MKISTDWIYFCVTAISFFLLSLAQSGIAQAEDQARAWVHLSTGSGFEYQSSFQSLAGFWNSQRWLVGDFDGDGKDDLVNIYKSNNGKATVWLHRSTDSGFEYKSSFQRLAGFSDSQRWLVGDFNGDGKDDLVNVYKGNGNKATAWVHQSTGSGFEYKSSFQRLAGFSDSQRWLVGDFDGDGKDDLVNVYGHAGKATTWVHRSTGSDFEYKSSFQRLAGFSDSQRWLVGDFDGDGKKDMVNVYGHAGKATAWVHRSTSSDFEYKSSFQRLAGFWDSQRWLVGDFDGDGKDDLVNVYGGAFPKPKAPDHLRITQVTENTISLEWRDRADNEDGFKISWVGTRKSYSTRKGSATLNKPNQESYTIKKALFPRYEYCIKVRAYNRGGMSLSSNEVCVTIPSPDAKELTFTYYLKRRIVEKGTIQYVLIWDPGPPKNAYLKSIQIPKPAGFPSYVVHLMKKNKPFSDCGKTSASIPFTQGQTTSPSQLESIYGTDKPRPPVAVLACLTQANPNQNINLIPIKIVYVRE